MDQKKDPGVYPGKIPGGSPKWLKMGREKSKEMIESLT